MTYGEIIDLANIYQDSFANPWMDPDRAVPLVYDSYLEWIKEKVGEIERTERITEDLMPLIRTIPITSGSIIDISQVTDFYLLALLRGTFRNVCHPNPNAVILRVIKKKDLQDLSSTDPFEKPTNEFPYYDQLNDGTKNIFVVDSDSAPLSMLLYYVIEPVKPTVANYTTKSPETLSITHSEIAKILARKFAYTSEDQRYPYTQQEIAQES